MSQELDISLAAMGRIMGAWQFVYLFAAIPLGLALDRLGLIYALFIAALLISVSSLLRGFAVDGVTLWLAVALFGLGGPLISVGAPKVISLWFESDERGLAMGIYMTGPALGSVLSLALINSVWMPLFDGAWRFVFILYFAIVLLAGLLWWAFNRLIPDSENKNIPAALADDEDERQLVSKFSTFAALLKLPVVRIILLMSVCAFIFSHGLGNWLPSILQEKGFTAIEAGYWSAMPMVIGVVASLTIPRLAKGSKHFLILSMVCLLVSLSLLGLIYLEGRFLLLALIALGVVRGSLMTLCILVLMQSPAVGAKHMGVAGGLFFTFAEIGGVAGPAGVGLLRDRAGTFDTSLIALLLVSLVLLALSLLAQRYSR